MYSEREYLVLVAKSSPGLILPGLYKRKSALNKASLMRKIMGLKCRDGESIVVHINTFMGLVNQLAAAKFPLDDAL